MNNETGAKSLRNLIYYENSHIPRKFRIPMYQRNYKWNMDVAEKLVKDIVTCYKKNVTKSVGLITLYKNDNNIFDVIDGQQRFITLSILLNILECDDNINLSFERDDKNNSKRFNAVKNNVNCNEKCTDVNRINRNRNKMQHVLGTEFDKEELKNYILDKVIMLCSEVNSLPVEEFMNLNAYKTAFSICDHIRANLIVLNSFHRDELEKENNISILAKCLGNHSYKTAVSILYNDIQSKLYDVGYKNGTYKNIYILLKNPEKVILDPKKESHINILFGGMLEKNSSNYECKEITENLDYWIKMLQKLAFVNKLLDELKCEFEQGEFHSFKQIDEYQKLTNKSFIREVFDGMDNEWDSQTLAKEIQKYSNVDSVLIRCLNQNLKKLANRYLEAFIHSKLNSNIYSKADSEESKKVELPHMKMDEVVEEISGCGRYIIDRYEIEKKDELNTYINIPPVLDLEDRENINFGGSLDDLDSSGENSDEISVGKLFKYPIKIPVIQRDYCMGARITGENDFLSFLLDGYNHGDKLSASTILLAVSKDTTNNLNKKELYIFDGQQRTFTIYVILKHCNDNELSEYSFVGRTVDNSQREYSSPYSKEAVKELISVFEKLIEEMKKNDAAFKTKFITYIKENVFFKVKIVDSVSGAEQFFMDINGGVALKKYEIYKAMLCNRLSELKQDNVVRKIENEWLNFFYRYRENDLNKKCENIQNNESDEEELLEIRFIEYICRFIYRKYHLDSNVSLLSFDEIESKGELFGKLRYINNLSKDDIGNIVNIMDDIIKIKFIEDENDVDSIKLSSQSMYKNSKDAQVKFCQLELQGTKKDVFDRSEYYINKFIWSLSDNNRKILQKYYKYKNMESLRKIYDNDEIINDILLNIVNRNDSIYNTDEERYPYQDYHYNKSLTIYGGYNNSNHKIIAERKFDKICKKEIPAYYAKEKEINENNKENILRLQYLYEKSENKNRDILYFALIKEKGIENEDGSGSNVRTLPAKIVPEDYNFVNRTEAYCLRYIDEYFKT